MPLSSLSIKAKGLDGRPYRVDVNGGGTDVVADRQFLVIDRGESQDRGLDPIWPSEARIFMRDVDVSPLFGKPDRSVPVEAFDIAGSADTLVFSGYMVTDFFGDAPFAADPIVELRALDGLGTLENDPIDDLYTGDSFVSYQTAIVEILRKLTPLGVEIGVHWYPSQSTITSDDNPLESVGFVPNNYRENRPEGGYLNQLFLLRDLLKGIGATVRQVDRRVESKDARWHVRQRDALNEDGTIQAWVYTAATDSPSPTTLDRSRPLSVSGLLQDHSRDFVRRRQTVQVTHDHVPLGNVIREPGFDEGGPEWTIDNSSTAEVDAEILSHDRAPEADPSPSATQDDTYLLRLFSESGSTGSEWPVSQQVTEIDTLPPGTVGKFKLTCHTVFPFERGAGGAALLPRLSVTGPNGTFYLAEFQSDVRGAVLSGNGSLPVQAIHRSIPQGARIPIAPKEENVDSGDSLAPRSYITLSERAESGDTTLFGEISREVKADWQIRYAGFSSTQVALPIHRWRNEVTDYGSFEVFFPWEQPGGDTLEGLIQIEIGGSVSNDGREAVDTFALFDDIELTFKADGGDVDQSVTQAAVPKLGETESQTIRTSSGPTTQNLARIRGNDPNGTGFEPTQWDIKNKVINGTPEVDSDTAAGSTSVPVSTGGGETLNLKAGQGVRFEGQEERYLLDADVDIGQFNTGTLDLKRGLESGLSAGDEVQLGSVSSAKLKAQQRLRYWQNHNEELTVTAYQRDGGLPLTGDELVQLDGTEYTVHSVEYDAAKGESRATLIEWNDYQ